MERLARIRGLDGLALMGARTARTDGELERLPLMREKAELFPETAEAPALIGLSRRTLRP
jgi:hypothetical protein